MSKIKRKKRDKQGFTLIELLAVIVILGVLLLISVPAVSKYIENSKRNTYVNTIKTMVSSVSTAVNAMELPFALKENEGMIVPFSEIELEKTSSTKKSPYANWVEGYSYVLVIFDGERYKYYVSALDEAGYAIALVNEKEMTINDITVDTEVINSNIVSYDDVRKNKYTSYDTDNFTIRYIADAENIVKVQIGSSVYSIGNVVQLKDGSRWFVLLDSRIEQERIDLISYFGMDIDQRKYGLQDSSNPTTKYHNEYKETLSYEKSDIYILAQNIISKTYERLEDKGIDTSGSTIKMPEITDFYNTRFGIYCNCFSNYNSSFWVINRNNNTKAFYLGKNMTELKTAAVNNSHSIRIVIKDLLKSNIDKEATKTLN
jgi:prepilin-type N-terminal cleavage/methylation domain-containing protein